MKNEIELCSVYFDKREIPTRRELWNKIEDLQSRLKDKEKDCQQLKEKLHTAEQETLHFHNKYFAEKQIAIEELEKLKDFFLEPYKDEEMDTDYLITKDAGEIADYLLDQIKQLKEIK